MSDYYSAPRTFSLKTFLVSLITSTLFLVGILSLAGCHTDPEVAPVKGIPISNVSIPSQIEVAAGEEVTLSGVGFEKNDEIKLVSTGSENSSYRCPVSAVD